jgi:hypothetical protein
MSFIEEAKLSLKFWFEFSKKNANFVADFSQIPGKWEMASISFSNSFGIITFYKQFLKL